MTAARLFWYNLWLPLRQRRIRREMLPAWIAEGRDPEHFPRLGRITKEDIEWARDVIERQQAR